MFPTFDEHPTRSTTTFDAERTDRERARERAAMEASASKRSTTTTTTTTRGEGGQWVVFEKNFYYEHPSVTARTRARIEEFMREREIRVTKGTDVPRCVETFDEASFPGYLTRDLKARERFKAPSAVQSQAWPVALSGRDLVAIAETGSGKTLSYVCPAIVHVNAQPVLGKGEGPIALVLAPTRELACQIELEVATFAASSEVKHVCVYGGVPKPPQIRALKTGQSEICVATPGRLIDFLDCGVTNLKRASFVVLDEADRMLDMGFEPQIRRILNKVRPDRQILMFTATWPREVREIARDFLKTDPVEIRIGGAGDGLLASKNVTQIVEVLEARDKYDRLIKILETEMDGSRLLVFVETKSGVDELTRKLRVNGWPALGLHGDKNQEERDWVLGEFRDGKSPIMLATGVASRGLDVDGIKCVINYDFPKDASEYVHRVGRTGRAGKLGKAYTFFTVDDGKHARELTEILKDAKQPIPSSLRQFASS